jgi:hypothetical protein
VDLPSSASPQGGDPGDDLLGLIAGHRQSGDGRQVAVDLGWVCFFAGGECQRRKPASASGSAAPAAS